jgi:heme/copper-type cytochrome/quinol oxidase subunit 2
MESDFEHRIRSAGVAGWWTLLICALVLVVQWMVYLCVMSFRPAWVLWLSGPGVTWEYLRHVWWVGTAILKLVLLLLAVPCLWVTLWARQLRKASAHDAARSSTTAKA